jgi:hypothetical protein
MSLIKSKRKRKRFNWKWSREVGIEANIDNPSKSLLYRIIKPAKSFIVQS